MCSAVLATLIDRSPDSMSSPVGKHKTIDDEESKILPPGWRKCWSTRKGRVYYFNPASGESSWERPTDVTKMAFIKVKLKTCFQVTSLSDCFVMDSFVTVLKFLIMAFCLSGRSPRKADRQGKERILTDQVVSWALHPVSLVKRTLGTVKETNVQLNRGEIVTSVTNTPLRERLVTLIRSCLLALPTKVRPHQPVWMNSHLRQRQQATTKASKSRLRKSRTDGTVRNVRHVQRNRCPKHEMTVRRLWKSAPTLKLLLAMTSYRLD